MSHAHLLRLFKKEYGITPIKYIINKRIELACELLKTTDLSVSSVAFSCGFSDEIHFMKTFKKLIGKSALNYKRSSLNET
ncbi:MAG: helix-turn-helix transcriptional regulator [Clostridia bacterium]|nr:helix-turn-helix transcriptional regulator [Clostridia bacterium]